jgi:hypothetical protein
MQITNEKQGENMKRLLLLATFGLLADVAAADPAIMQDQIQKILNDQSAAIDRSVEARLDALVEQAVFYRRSRLENAPRAVFDERATADQQLLHLEASQQLAAFVAR